jgi:hypothetical protein
VTHNDHSSLERLVVGPDEEGLRLDVFCATRIEELSRNQIQRHNARGRILVDAVSRPDRYKVKAGDEVTLSIPPPSGEEKTPLPQTIPLDVVFEDDDIIIINKPAGIVVHPAHGNWDGTVVNALLGLGVRLSQIGDPNARVWSTGWTRTLRGCSSWQRATPRIGVYPDNSGHARCGKHITPYRGVILVPAAARSTLRLPGTPCTVKKWPLPSVEDGRR